MATPRTIRSVHPAVPTSDGAGVRLYRALGHRALPQVDPFLLLDEFRSDRADDYIAGFPDHPHRGFETVTYMLAGAMHHRDSVGNSGHLRAGSVQWMTAGRGIIHSEMPEQVDGLMWGFQIWVNLPAAHKMQPPRYQDIPPEDIPVVADGAATVKVIAGAAGGVTGPVRGIVTEPDMLDVSLPAGATWRRLSAEDRNALIYLFGGSVEVGGVTVPDRHLAALSPGDRLEVVAGADGGRFLFLEARPCREPIARYGPFVMNTAEEIRQAIDDFRRGRFVA